MTEKTEKQTAEIEAIRKKEYFEKLTMETIHTAAALLPHRVEDLPELTDSELDWELRKITNQLMYAHCKFVGYNAFGDGRIEAGIYEDIDRLDMKIRKSKEK